MKWKWKKKTKRCPLFYVTWCKKKPQWRVDEKKKSNFKFPMKYKPNQIEKKTIINNSQKVYWKAR